MRVLGWLLLGMGCRPYVPPDVTPPLVVARAPLRIIKVQSDIPSAELVVRAGSAYDPPGREGLAFVTAQIVGLRLGASVEVGLETVIFTLPATPVPDAAAALLSPVQPVELEYARELASARLRSARCAQVAQDVGLAWAFAGHPYGHAVAGRHSSLPTLTSAEISAFYAARYVRDAALLTATHGGWLDPQLDAAFAPMLSRSPTPAVKPSTHRPTLVVEAEVESTCIFVALSPPTQTRQNVAQLAWAATRPGWTPAPANVDDLGWAVAPFAEMFSILPVVPPALVLAPPPSMPPPPAVPLVASDNVPPPKRTFGSGDAAAATLLSEVPRLLKAPPLEIIYDSGWLRQAMAEEMLMAVVVTPDASLWRDHESSATLVVLDREAVLR